MSYNIEIINRLSGAGLASAANNIAGRAGVGFNGLFFYRNTKTNQDKEQEKGEYEVNNEDDLYQDIEEDELSLRSENLEYVFNQYPTFVRFSHEKLIVSTPINDGDGEGEVVEKISKLPTSVEITGILVDEQFHVYPHDLVKELRTVFKEDEVLEVSSDLFDSQDIESIYIIKMGIEPVAAYPDTVKYSIVAKSIKPVELLILEQ